VIDERIEGPADHDPTEFGHQAVVLGELEERSRVDQRVVPLPANQRLDTTGAAGGDVNGFPNGRRLFDDVVDIELRYVLNSLPNINAIPFGDGVASVGAVMTPASPLTGTAEERLRAAVASSPDASARLRDAAGGACGAEGPLVAETALRGEWQIRCATGALRVAITLAPTARPGVQFLSVRPMAAGETLEKPRSCR
jgi:hypothetical protein